MKKYRKKTLEKRGAASISFVAEKEDQARIEAIMNHFGTTKTGAIRKALELADKEVGRSWGVGQ
ncbi:MAG: hypothetical protein CL583_13250 [Alteromonadaceae bacterium]|nr:hypothetical protein [Alteromonadaceae bacterium]